MRARSKGVTLLTAIGMLSAYLIASAPVASSAAANYEVQVGAPLFALPQAQHAPADGMRFYAPALKVHTGDIVTFALDGFHTATMLPANTDADTWVAANALGPGKPYSFIVPDPDEGSDGLKGNNKSAIASQLDCGNSTDPCPYDGSQVVNSGLFDVNNLQGNKYAFSVRIDASPGTEIWVLCLVHLRMRLQISVVADTETASTQAEIDAFASKKVVADARAANKLNRSLLSSTAAYTAASSGGTVKAFAGYDGPHFALDAFYPRKLVLRKGQRVEWQFDQLMFEDHTVTFPAKKAFKITNTSFFPPVCDPDGDTGTMPDEPANVKAATIDDVCPGGPTQIEFDLDPRFAPPAGDGVVTSAKDFENAGVHGASFGAGSPFKLRFTQKSEKVPFTFICMIHPFMHGKVIVG